jgi:lactoylglutathione lyase
VSQVCVISIYVPNLQKAIDFYTKTLEFEMDKQYGSKIVLLKHEGLPIVLEENENAINNQESSVRGVVLGLHTNNIYQTVQLLKEKDVNFIIEEPTDFPPGKYISFIDPFGNILEYIQFD